MKLGIEGYTAVVLGGTSGLGWAVAQKLANEKVNIVLVGRDSVRLEECAASLPSAVAVAVDLSDAASVETIVQVADTTFGGADIVILNGGGPKPGTALELTSENYE